MTGSVHIGFFEDSRDVLDAAKECRERSIPIVDVISPYPVHGLDEVLDIKRSRLPWVTLIFGGIGLASGFALQFWTASVDWPLNVGGKPLNSLPAFVVVAFELTILFAGLATVAALFLRTRLWPGRKWTPGLELTTDNRLALILAQRDASFPTEVYQDLLRRHGAIELRLGDEVIS
ncbi:MAG: hypothetical protein ACI8QC_001100 [Planctomycetota bacterium]|jgi:hypothetical protein